MQREGEREKWVFHLLFTPTIVALAGTELIRRLFPVSRVDAWAQRLDTSPITFRSHKQRAASAVKQPELKPPPI